MTELREPPLLSNKEIVLKEVRIPTGDSISGVPVVWTEKEVDVDAMLKAQRQADIKWMKENCYLKAERELPEMYQGFNQEGVLHSWLYHESQRDMLKEVDGVAYRACKEFKS